MNDVEHFSAFSITVVEYLDRNNLREKEFLFCPTVGVCHGGEITAAGTYDSWSCYVHSQETMMDK